MGEIHPLSEFMGCHGIKRYKKVQIQINPDMGHFTMKHHETISLQLLSHLLRLYSELIFWGLSTFSEGIWSTRVTVHGFHPRIKCWDTIYVPISNNIQQYEILGFVHKWCAGAYAVRYSAVRMPISNGSVCKYSPRCCHCPCFRGQTGIQFQVFP